MTRRDYSFKYATFFIYNTFAKHKQSLVAVLHKLILRLSMLYNELTDLLGKVQWNSLQKLKMDIINTAFMDCFSVSEDKLS